jgi:hypothetical protein
VMLVELRTGLVPPEGWWGSGAGCYPRKLKAIADEKIGGKKNRVRSGQGRSPRSDKPVISDRTVPPGTRVPHPAAPNAAAAPCARNRIVSADSSHHISRTGRSRVRFGQYGEE